MFLTVPLSIIKSFPLYTQQWYMSYRRMCNASSITTFGEVGFFLWTQPIVLFDVQVTVHRDKFL